MVQKEHMSSTYGQIERRQVQAQSPQKALDWNMMSQYTMSDHSHDHVILYSTQIISTATCNMGHWSVQHVAVRHTF